MIQQPMRLPELISLNVGKPRLMVYGGETINSGIFKKPVTGRVALRTLNLDGDRQADLSVHGGPYKAVYGYASEHYGYWRQELPDADLPWGRSAKILRQRGWRKRSFILATDCALVRRF
jgi:MOSC domain-containing protein YiiM